MLPHYNLFCNKISHVRTNINVIIKLLVSYMSLLMCFISFCKCFMSLLISVLLTLYNCILWFYACIIIVACYVHLSKTCAIYTYSYIIWPYTYRINKSVINLYYSCWPFVSLLSIYVPFKVMYSLIILQLFFYTTPLLHELILIIICLDDFFIIFHQMCIILTDNLDIFLLSPLLPHCSLFSLLTCALSRGIQIWQKFEAKFRNSTLTTITR